MEGRSLKKPGVAKPTYRSSRNSVPAQPPTTFGMSLNMQSRADLKTVPLAGEYSQGPTTPHNGLLANRDTTASPFDEEVMTYLASDRTFQMGSTAPMNPPLANSGLLTPSLTPDVSPHPPGPAKTHSRDREGNSALTEVNPESGSITGGARIWLKGIDFPALFPLFARFGTTVVPTVSLRD